MIFFQVFFNVLCCWFWEGHRVCGVVIALCVVVGF